MSSVLILTNISYNFLRPESFYFCQKSNIVLDNIIKFSKLVEDIIIANDAHSIDDIEFSYIPKHCLNNNFDNIIPPDFIKSINNNNLTICKKNTTDCLKSEHILQLLKNHSHDDIYFGGFCTSIDVFCSAVSASQFFRNVRIVKNCTSDLSQDAFDIGINHANFLGVKTI